MLNLVAHSIWHGTISMITWTRTKNYRAAGNSWIADLDHGAFYVFIGIFVVIHLIAVIWLFLVPLKHRKQMKEKDRQYRARIQNKTITKTSFSKQRYATLNTEV